MCCNVSKVQQTLLSPKKVYKVVAWVVDSDGVGRYMSEFMPHQRESWQESEDPAVYLEGGEYIEYKVGEEVESPSGPGIFAYDSLEALFLFHPGTCIRNSWNMVVLELEIPAGTNVRWGPTWCRTRYVAAEKVKVIRKVEEV